MVKTWKCVLKGYFCAFVQKSKFFFVYLQQKLWVWRLMFCIVGGAYEYQY